MQHFHQQLHANGQCESVLSLFNSMRRKTSVFWNSMISGFLSNGRFELAHKMFDQMPWDLVTWNIIFYLIKCLKEMLSHRMHCYRGMLNGYVDEAKRTFDEIPVKNEISWNRILAAYVQNGRIEEARRLFNSKESWAVVSWNCLMGGYLKKRMLLEARQICDRMPMMDEVLLNTMIS
ncbi:hypothetical protein M9H77_27130 [Catharanthus roseus]|uniref:Uncharacterized protein n=1 Tax=Catharanthus roseus TaxID=4058 RepID=A0ACC0AEB7_CATRO|nr:hypothetical protein M9H77_27130 [Catharanthus roseus]